MFSRRFNYYLDMSMSKYCIIQKYSLLKYIKTLEGSNLTELCWNIYLKDFKKKDLENESANVKNRKQKKSDLDKMSLSYGAFQEKVNCVHLQSLTFNEAD